MRKVFFGISVISLLILCFFLFTGQKSSFTDAETEKSKTGDPLLVTLRYCELARKARYSEISLLITNIPAKYYEYKQSKILQNSLTQNRGFKESPPSSIDNTDYQLIYSDYPEIIRENNEYVKAIKLFQKKEDEARVIVIMGNQDIDGYAIELEFLLHEKDNSWKIFMVRSTVEAEKYGMPEI